MNILQLVIGLLGILWGSLLIYYAKSESVPSLIRPLVRISYFGGVAKGGVGIVVGVVMILFAILALVGSLRG